MKRSELHLGSYFMRWAAWCPGWVWGGYVCVGGGGYRLSICYEETSGCVTHRVCLDLSLSGLIVGVRLALVGHTQASSERTY